MFELLVSISRKKIFNPSLKHIIALMLIIVKFKSTFKSNESIENNQLIRKRKVAFIENRVLIILTSGKSCGYLIVLN